ncbi:MAG: DUF4287 domain-containing protein [Myxococcales bacterium]|nr:DUF4287 domain-containing protein [Myxococcales bacterium]
MGKMEDARATQIANIEERTGVSMQELITQVRARGFARHSEMVAMLKAELGMGHGDANLVAHLARADDDADRAEPADAWYDGAKAAQRPIHDAVVARIAAFGDDIEHSPKKTYLSLRRAKQFAMVGPAARGTVEVSINLKGAEPDERMQAVGPGKMCTHRTRIASLDEVDDALLDWVRRAYDAAG